MASSSPSSTGSRIGCLGLFLVGLLVVFLVLYLAAGWFVRSRIDALRQELVDAKEVRSLKWQSCRVGFGLEGVTAVFDQPRAVVPTGGGDLHIDCERLIVTSNRLLALDPPLCATFTATAARVSIQGERVRAAQVSATLRADSLGALDNAKGRYTVDAQQVSYEPQDPEPLLSALMPVDRVQARGTVNGPAVTLDRGALSSRVLDATGSGSVHLEPDLADSVLDFRIEIALRPGIDQSPLILPLARAGIQNGTLAIQGTLANPRLPFRARVGG